MNATTVAVDLAKNLFQLAYADANWKLVGTARLTRSQFRRCFQNTSVSLVIMEACGSAHYWARQLQERGIEVRLLPARYVRAYVKRNKTDAADAAALLEAARCADIQPVRIKSVEQQALQSLHRTRSLWMSTRTSRINALRGFCREFGIDIALGARLGLEQIARVLADSNSLLPELLRPTMRSMVEEIHLLEVRINDPEKQLGELARQSAALHYAAVSPRRRPAHCHCDGRRHQRRGLSLQRRTPLRRLVRTHTERTLLRSDPPHRPHLQARRSVSAHAAHARRTRRDQRRKCRDQNAAPARSAATLGIAGPATQQSQQGRLCPRQQARTHLLRRAA